MFESFPIGGSIDTTEVLLLFAIIGLGAVGAVFIVTFVGF